MTAAEYIEQWERWAFDGWLHPGRHCPPNKCLECGRFSAHSWTTGWVQSENGNDEWWGGTCSIHGEWSESVL